MPLLVLLIVLLGLALLVVLLLPVTLVMRYRAGTTRRQARGWVAAVNIAGLMLSAAMYLAAAGLASVWTRGAFVYALSGLAAGSLLGVIGLLLTRWEATRGRLLYTPNAWLVLVVTTVVAARIAYGLWRVWHAWSTGFDHTSLIVADGVRGSIAASGIVLGYYATFWIGVLRRLRRAAVTSGSRSRR